MGAFEVPTAGISLDGQMYVVVDTNHSPGWTTDRAVLTRAHFPLTPSGFEPLRTLSQRPTGKFIKESLHVQPKAIAGLPPGGPFVLLWGTGEYRHSDAYLSIVPQRQFERGGGTLYYAGVDAGGAPLWAPNESAATAIVRNGTMGDLSVTWCKDLDLWLMTYDSRPPAQAGILFSYARTPWGPWSPPQVIFNAQRDGALGKFIHDPRITPDDGLEGPVIGKAQEPGRRAGRELRSLRRGTLEHSPQPGARRTRTGPLLPPLDVESIRRGAHDFPVAGRYSNAVACEHRRALMGEIACEPTR